MLVGLGAAPFAAGVVSNALIAAGPGAPNLICPFRALTGLPCPFCGASRAFRLAAEGNPDFLQYNAWWVLVAAIAVITGLWLLLTARRGGASSTGPHPSTGAPPTNAPTPATATIADRYALVDRQVALVAVLVTAGWAVALVNASAITS